jgi:hypothetical protein
LFQNCIESGKVRCCFLYKFCHIVRTTTH